MSSTRTGGGGRPALVRAVVELVLRALAADVRLPHVAGAGAVERAVQRVAVHEAHRLAEHLRLLPVPVAVAQRAPRAVDGHLHAPPLVAAGRQSVEDPLRHNIS